MKHTTIMLCCRDEYNGAERTWNRRNHWNQKRACMLGKVYCTLPLASVHELHCSYSCIGPFIRMGALTIMFNAVTATTSTTDGCYKSTCIDCEQCSTQVSQQCVHMLCKLACDAMITTYTILHTMYVHFSNQSLACTKCTEHPEPPSCTVMSHHAVVTTCKTILHASVIAYMACFHVPTLYLASLPHFTCTHHHVER